MKWKSIWGNDLGSHLWKKKNWSRMGQQPEARNQRSFLSRGGSTDSLIRKWYLERVKQALLPNYYQSKRDWRKLLVSADCVQWVDRQQTAAVEKKPGKDRHKSHNGFKKKLYFYLAFNITNGEIRYFPPGKEVSILRMVRQLGLCSNLQFRALRYGLPTGCFLD